MAPFILVALDASDTSLWAVERALILSRAKGWKVRAVHVADRAAARELADVERKLRSLIEGRFPVADIHLVVRIGSAGRVLDEEAADAGCLLVVVGASEKSFMGSLMLGKTAEQILAMVSKPVLVVHGEPSEDYRHVVAAVDFEIQSRNALREALLLDLVPDNIELIHAFPRGLPTPTWPANTGPASEAGASEAEISLRFSELLRDLDVDPGRARVEMREGPAFTVVANFLDETGADLVILGCYGKGPLTRRALGSTTMGLLQKAAADVLVAGRPSP